VRKMHRTHKEQKAAEKMRDHRLRAEMDGDAETMPLIQDAAAHQVHAPSVGTGVTVDWSTEEESNGDIDSDIDVDGIYNEVPTAGNVTVTAC